MSPLPARKPCDRFLQASEASRRLGQCGFASRSRISGSWISDRQIETRRPQIGKGGESGHRKRGFSFNSARGRESAATKQAIPKFGMCV
jgi:hypothetical protein